MSVTTSCPEGITSETLSVWGDGGLPEAEAARLRAHVAGCPACQERLRAFSDVNRLVSGQRIPTAPPVDIAAVRAGRSHQRAPRRLGRRGMPRTVWGGLGAAVAAALLIAAFSQVFARLGHVSPTSTVTPATTATPTSKLAWSERTLPPGLTLDGGSLAYAFSPANNQDAWICTQTAGGSFTIWETTDQARSWRVAGQLTQRLTTSQIFGCTLMPDSVNPHVLALSFGWGCGECGTLSGATYISGDGGATWRAMPRAVGIASLATIGARTYALTDGATSLLLSDDGLATWRAAGPSAAGTTFFYLWPNLTTGALLIGDQSNHLWRTENGGASWTEITLSRNIQINGGEGAWLPSLGVWRICGQEQLAAPIQCTIDLGKTWTSQPYLLQVVNCTNCNKGGGSLVSQTGCPPETMEPDGSLLAYCQQAATVTFGQPGVWNIYRLAPGATAWESLGSPPSSVSHPFPTPLPGTPVDASSQMIGRLILTGDLTVGANALNAVWYSNPLKGILVVASLPS